MSRTDVAEAVAAISRGDFVIVVDDVDRENEGDLIMAAEKVSERAIAFMVRYTSGLICLPVIGARLDELGLPLMVAEGTDSHHTAFTVSVDAKEGTTTGISAADRAATIRAVIDPATIAGDLARPGHIFPLRYTDGGVLQRPGHTEAAVDLARLAGCYPAGVLCEIVNDDGTMARGADLDRFAAEHGLPLITIDDLIAFRCANEDLIERLAEASLPTRHGPFHAIGYRSLVDGREHLALVAGELGDEPLVRVHSECLTGDVVGSLRCDCGPQLDKAMELVAAGDGGVVLYFRGHEGRGIGLMYKLRAYALQDAGRDTVDANLELGFPADARDYGVGAQILRDLGVKRLRLLTNNPAKQAGLEAHGVEVVQRVPLVVEANSHNRDYLAAKQSRLGHIMDVADG